MRDISAHMQVSINFLFLMKDPLNGYHLRGEIKNFCRGNMEKIPLKDTTEKSKNRPFHQKLFLKNPKFFFATQRPLVALEIPPKRKKFC